ncbi:MAG: ABC transporter permease [Pseudomonadota bacterium]
MKIYFRGLILFLLLLLIWQGIVWLFHLPAYILPSPFNVAEVFYQQPHLLLHQSIPTLIATILGFSLGTFFGLFAAIIVCLYKPVRNWLLPLLIVSQALPTFAIAPLLVIWFGYGLASKIIICVLMVFFPITSATYDGLRATPKAWLDLATIMGGNKRRKLWHLQLPAALPHFASGIRVASVYAPMGAIIGEWVGASSGLGYLMLNANARLQIDVVFATLIIILVFALVLYFIVDKLMAYLIPWQKIGSV